MYVRLDTLWKHRHNPVLDAVVTYTEELANQQAKEADGLLAQGVYLGTFFSDYNRINRHTLLPLKLL